MGILKNISKKGADAKAEKKASAKKVVAKKTDDAKKEQAPALKPTKTVERQDKTDAYRIISHPLVTEKAERQHALGKYTFMVAKDANKIEVARAIRDIYGVTPVSVNIQKMKGKQVRFGRFSGRRKDEKKAVVTLKEGETLSVTEAA